MRLNKIIRKLKLKFYETNKNISNIIGSYNLVGSLIVLLTIILNFGFNDILIKQQNIIIFIASDLISFERNLTAIFISSLLLRF